MFRRIVMSTRVRILLVALVGVWLVTASEVRVAAVEPVPAKAFSVVCDDLCSQGASCWEECWLTQFEFDQDYPSTTCGDEGYDCCGNDVCDTLTEGCNVCQDDCGWVPSCESECIDDGDCDPGEICNSAKECIPAPSTPVYEDDETTCGGECTSNSDCCGFEVCSGDPGLKVCGIPSRTYCPSAPPCSGTLLGIPYSNCDFSDPNHCQYGAWPAYCDPGIDRCQFVESGYACPDVTTNICYAY
jgi:hypothetical protein